MIYYIPAIIIATIILLLSTVLGAQAPNPIPELISPDKIGHFLAYGGLALAALWGYARVKRQYKPSNIWWIIGFVVVYGVVLELVQYGFFPNRYFEWGDMIANSLGALSATLVNRFFK